MTKLFLVAALLLGGCGAARKAAVKQTGPVFVDSMAAIQSETDLEIARASIPPILKLLEGLLETAPGDRHLLELAARGWIEYTFGFVEDDLEAVPDDAGHADDRQRLTLRATALYERAFGYATRLLHTHDDGIEQALAGDADGLKAHVAKLGGDDTPGLALAGIALAALANLNRKDPSHAVDLPKALVLLERSDALDPSYAFWSGRVFLASLECDLPTGDPKKGIRMMDEAIARSGGQLLLPLVMRARHCSVRTGDRAGFEKTLRQVLAAPPSTDRHFNLINEVAKRRAARYLDETRRYF